MSVIISGIVNSKGGTPENYILSQNYPNPFNPVTKIKFTVASTSPYPLQRGTPVTKKVYDLLGKVVTTLVNEELKAGMYQVRFDADDLPSGVYFYKLETSNIKETKKMLILKDYKTFTLLLQEIIRLNTVQAILAIL